MHCCIDKTWSRACLKTTPEVMLFEYLGTKLLKTSPWGFTLLQPKLIASKFKLHSVRNCLVAAMGSSLAVVIGGLYALFVHIFFNPKRETDSHVFKFSIHTWMLSHCLWLQWLRGWRRAVVGGEISVEVIPIYVRFRLRFIKQKVYNPYLVGSKNVFFQNCSNNNGTQKTVVDACKALGSFGVGFKVFRQSSLRHWDSFKCYVCFMRAFHAYAHVWMVHNIF